MNDDDRALEWVAAQREPMCERVAAWASIASGTRDLDGLARMAHQTARALGDLGADVETLAVSPERAIDADGRLVEHPLGPVVIGTKHRDASVRVLLACHMDTVFGPDDSFREVTRRGADVLCGPGVTDAKGGIVVMLTALEALERDSLAGRLGWQVVLNSDEEIGSPGSAALLRERAAGHDCGLVYEPALVTGDLVSARKGSGNFTIVVRGVRAHAGREPERGRNAVVAAARLAAMLDDIGRRRAGVTVNVARIEGGAPYNVVPDLAIVRFNVRVATDADLREVEREIGDLVVSASTATGPDADDGVSASLDGEFRAPPRPVTAGMRALMEEIDACATRLGIRFGWQATGGVCDGNRLAAAGLTTVDTLGPRGAGIHSRDEHLFVDSLAERARLSALLLRKLADGRIDATAFRSGKGR